MDVRVVEADLTREDQASALVALLDAFVQDPAVAGVPLAPEVREHVALRLHEHPTTRTWLAYDGETPVGFAIGVLGFSSFAARPVMNVHDLGVQRELRGRGVGHALLSAMEREARTLGCCKLTLEVREDNTRARRLYDFFGFGNFEPGEERVPTFFLEKKLAG